jgi:hypothetical protein
MKNPGNGCPVLAQFCLIGSHPFRCLWTKKWKWLAACCLRNSWSTSPWPQLGRECKPEHSKAGSITGPSSRTDEMVKWQGVMWRPGLSHGGCDPLSLSSIAAGLPECRRWTVFLPIQWWVLLKGGTSGEASGSNLWRQKDTVRLPMLGWD